MCVADFEFFVITNQTGLNHNDGILGLSPAHESQNGPSYIKALYEQGIIDEEVATFWLNFYTPDDIEKSIVTLGGVIDGSYRGEPFTQSLKTRYDSWWTVKMHDVKYGDSDIKDSGIGYAIIDSGTSLLYLGQKDYYNFVDKVKAEVPELDCSSNIYCYSNDYTCEELTPRMSSLMIQLQDNHYTLPPAAYTFSQGKYY